MTADTFHARDPGRVLSTLDDPCWSSCEERVAASLARIAKVEPHVLAWRELDEAGALERARTLDRIGREGGRCGALHGVPVAIKDVIDVAGLPTRCQSAARAQSPAARSDAHLVMRLRQAGAVILGKAHTTEYAYFDPSPARNPQHIGHTPGGSSSGSAVAVAAGMAAGAIGTQTVASVNRPATYCGIAAFKPSTGALSTFGVTPLAPMFDTVGFFGWRVADAVRLFEAVCPDHLPAPVEAAKPRALSVVALQDPLLGAASDEVQGLARHSADRLRAAGHRVVARDSCIDFERLRVDQLQATFYQLGRVHAPLLDLAPELLGPKLRAAIIEGLRISDVAFHGACLRMDEARRSLFTQLGDADAVLWPAAPATAPEGLAWTGDPSFISPWTALGGPIVTVRVGSGAQGLPIGMLLTARPGTDRAFAQTAVRLADALEDPACGSPGN